MELAATSSSALETESNHHAVEKCREKQIRRIEEAISGLKFTDQVEFLTSRLAEANLNSTERKHEADLLRRENAKLKAKLGSAEKLLSKTEVAKSKLEQLCRELSKAQREEKEQNHLRVQQMQKVHAETVESFKKSLAEIQLSVEAKQEHSRRVADVEKLSTNLNQLTSDYEARLTELKKLYEEREADLSVIAKTKDQELAGLYSQIEEMQKRVHEVFSENVTLKKELLTSEDRVRKSIESEIGLRKMLDEYSAKYSALTKSLSQSNSSFDKVKEQMSKMNGNLIRVESDARKWKSKAEEAASIVTSLRGERTETLQLLALKDRQLAQLQELCRRLQKSTGEEEEQQPQCNGTSTAADERKGQPTTTEGTTTEDDDGDGEQQRNNKDSSAHRQQQTAVAAVSLAAPATGEGKVI